MRKTITIEDKKAHRLEKIAEEHTNNNESRILRSGLDLALAVEEQMNDDADLERVLSNMINEINTKDIYNPYEYNYELTVDEIRDIAADDGKRRVNPGHVRPDVLSPLSTGVTMAMISGMMIHNGISCIEGRNNYKDVDMIIKTYSGANGSIDVDNIKMFIDTNYTELRTEIPDIRDSLYSLKDESETADEELSRINNDYYEPKKLDRPLIGLIRATARKNHLSAYEGVSIDKIEKIVDEVDF